MEEDSRMPCIEMEDVYFRYDDESEWTLQKINFKVHPGERVTILGGNGSGKSTLARLMNGLYTPNRGNVRCFGTLIQEADPLWNIRRRIGIVLQNPDHQIFGATVEEDIAFGLENVGFPVDEIERRRTAVMDRLNISHLKKAEVCVLSPGQKQLAATAGIAVMDPEVVVMDDCMSMLDSENASAVYGLLGEMNRRGAAVVWITSDPEKILENSRVLVMHRGLITYEGEALELIDQSGLKEIGFLPPFRIRLLKALEQKGVTFPRDRYNQDDWVEQLWASALKM
jgi:energy-coupling factor transport system ATP-binding protein